MLCKQIETKMKKLILIFAIAISAFTANAQTTTLNHSERNYWNGFVDFIASKGLKGSTDLDKKDKNLSQTLFAEYNYLHNQNVDYTTFVTRVQLSIIDYRNRAITQIKTGHAFLDGYVKGDSTYNFDKNFMLGLSKADSWSGSKTTSWKFPTDIVTYHIHSEVYTKWNDCYAKN